MDHFLKLLLNLANNFSERKQSGKHPVASKLFNIAAILSNFNVSDYLTNLKTCQCKKCKFAMNHMAMLLLEI